MFPAAAAAAAKSLQSCPTLYDPIDGQATRLPRPWDSPGKNTGVGCHFLLHFIKVKSESEVAQPRPTCSDPMDCSLLGSSVHGIFQVRVLEWRAIVPYYPIIYNIVYYICICINSLCLCIMYMHWVGQKIHSVFLSALTEKNSKEFSNQSNIMYINMLYCINNKVIGNKQFLFLFLSTIMLLFDRNKIYLMLLRLPFWIIKQAYMAILIPYSSKKLS